MDRGHPDLEDNILLGINATMDPISGDGSADLDNDHGTNCAGIIGAIDNEIGIKGVSSHSKIIPVRIANGRILEDQWFINGIIYAYRTAKADVISCSMNIGDPSSAITDVLNSALTNGRNGKGCVIVFAAGNDNVENIPYPANAISDIISVGAMSPCGQRKAPKSCDGENWGSNYGAVLDVVAPGVKIPTTTLLDHSYTMSFNGTSAACPHVSGVAALLLSVYPFLTQKEVSSIILGSTRKLPNYNYSNTSGHPYGSWNNETGYGLVDAFSALNYCAEPVIIADKVITSYTKIERCGPVYLNNISIMESGQLEVSTHGDVTIQGDFECVSGGTMEINPK